MSRSRADVLCNCPHTHHGLISDLFRFSISSQYEEGYGHLEEDEILILWLVRHLETRRKWG
jgi:hypothetical protein